eukprot:3477378-Pleurochrysis_carterae.AAC.1
MRTLSTRWLASGFAFASKSRVVEPARTAENWRRRGVPRLQWRSLQLMRLLAAQQRQQGAVAELLRSCVANLVYEYPQYVPRSHILRDLNLA